MTKPILTEVSEIVLLEGNGNYTTIHYRNGQKVMMSYTLLRYEEVLVDFHRVSRKYLINPLFIERCNLNGESPHVVLKNGLWIKLPRRKAKTNFL